ncbi:hypothetical protein [Bacillus sp. EB01]|uniref:hypothetical protein n=1 Tax=Bacillus sp. EB01 TaxID=1347086 RepID=UPI0005C74464|nr:hypothetical protein [Bacillus sp. EB01]
MSQLRDFIGLRLRLAGRASNLFWLGFGDIITLTRRGESQNTAEFALHIECSWRITIGNKIFIASRDFYVPSSSYDGVIEDFDWDIQGNNRFDERIKNFMKEKENLTVLKIDSDHIGGLNILLSEGYKLDVFPDSSDDDENSEHWRFFNRKGETPHFIVTGSGIDKV